MEVTGRADVFRKRVEEYVRKWEMFSPEDTVVVGVSGGADSMALLSLLTQWQGKLLKRVCVVHVHHGIRGDEADRDAEFVRSASCAAGLECRIIRRDVPSFARNRRVGCEEAGRIIRYQIFEEIGRELSENGERVKIASAHHGDDLAETMLHHLARGTGLRGLAGIRPVQGDRIRPLLCVDRMEIEEYLQEKGIAFLTDSTNLEETCTRNRIRHQVLPVLKEQVNAGTVRHMRELAELSSDADRYLSGEAERKLSGYREENLIPDAFFQEPEILVCYGIRILLEELAGQSRDLTAEHVKSVQRLSGSPVGRSISLPCGITVSREYQGLRFHRESGTYKEQIRLEENSGNAERIWIPRLEEGEERRIEDFTMHVFPFYGQKIPKNKYTKWFDYDRIEKNLCLRHREGGDYLILDVGGRKKMLRRYLIDEKIPREERAGLWLLASGQEVFWVVGGRTGETGLVRETTRQVLEITYKGEWNHE